MFYYCPLFSSEAGLALVLTETETAVALGTGLGVFTLLSSRINGLFIYELEGYLIYSNGKPGHISRVL